MKKLWLIQGFFCQGYGGLQQRSAVPEMFSGTFWHAGHKESNSLVGRMSDTFGDSELNEIEFLDADELFFHKHYVEKPGERPRSPAMYRLTKEAEGLWWSGEYVVDLKPKPFKGPARCIITEVTLDPVEADLAKFAKDHGFEAPEHVET